LDCDLIDLDHFLIWVLSLIIKGSFCAIEIKRAVYCCVVGNQRIKRNERCWLEQCRVMFDNFKVMGLYTLHEKYMFDNIFAPTSL
jgi:hypothetical protein